MFKRFQQRFYKRCGLLALLPWAAQAGDLESLLLAAERHDAGYAAARESWQAGSELLPQARAALYPSLKLTARTDRNRFEQGATRASYNSNGYTLALSQPLFNRALGAASNQAAAMVAKNEIDLRQAQQALILRLAAAWFDLGRAQATLAALQAQQQAVEAQRAQAKLAFEIGSATITDTHEAQARLDLITAQRIAAENDVTVKQTALGRIVGALPANAPKAATRLPQPDQGEAAWIAQARNGNLSVLAAQQTENAAREAIKIKRAGFLPTLDLNASYIANNDSMYLGNLADSRNGRIGLDLTWPLYQGGATRSQTREATANLAAAGNKLEDARRAAEQETREAWLGFISGQQRIAALEAARHSAEAQLKSTQLGLEVGVRTRIDLLNADQQWHQTRRDLELARYDLMLARLKLEAAVGDLNGSDLVQLDALPQ